MPRVISEKIVPHHLGSVGPINNKLITCNVTFRGQSVAEAEPEIRYEIQDLTDKTTLFGVASSLCFVFDQQSAIDFRIGHDEAQEPIGEMDIEWRAFDERGDRVPVGQTTTCKAYKTMVFQSIAFSCFNSLETGHYYKNTVGVRPEDFYTLRFEENAFVKKENPYIGRNPYEQLCIHKQMTEFLKAE